MELLRFLVEWMNERILCRLVSLLDHRSLAHMFKDALRRPYGCPEDCTVRAAPKLFAHIRHHGSSTVCLSMRLAECYDSPMHLPILYGHVNAAYRAAKRRPHEMV